jgi:hypothetical protein
MGTLEKKIRTLRLKHAMRPHYQFDIRFPSFKAESFFCFHTIHRLS